MQVIRGWICTNLHRRWWKAEWIAGDTQISLKCDRCGRVY
jgi:hypothetical protein